MNRKRKPGEQVTWFRGMGNAPIVRLAAVVVRDDGARTRIRLAIGEGTEHTVTREALEDGWRRADRRPEVRA